MLVPRSLPLAWPPRLSHFSQRKSIPGRTASANACIGVPKLTMHPCRCCSQLSASRTMSSTSAAPSNANAFLQAVEHRRTIYALSKESPIPDARIQEIVEFAVKNCPVSPMTAWCNSSEMLTAVRGLSRLSTRNPPALFSCSARTTTSESSCTSRPRAREGTDRADLQGLGHCEEADQGHRSGGCVARIRDSPERLPGRIRHGASLRGPIRRQGPSGEHPALR